jgi:hypothetical protein
MRRDNGSLSFRLLRLKDGPDRPSRLRIKACGRLVEKEHRWRLCECNCDAKPPPHPTGERACSFVERIACQFDFFGKVARRDSPPRESNALEHTVKLQVLADGEVRPDFVELSRYTPHINITLSVDGTTGGEAHRAPSAIGDSNADLRTDADMLVHRSHLCRDIEAAYVSITTTRPGKAG